MDPISLEKFQAMLEKYGKSTEEASQIVDEMNRDGDAILHPGEAASYNLLKDLNQIDANNDHFIALDEIMQNLIKEAAEKGVNTSTPERQAVLPQITGELAKAMQQAICENNSDPAVHDSMKAELGNFVVELPQGSRPKECGPLIS